MQQYTKTTAMAYNLVWGSYAEAFGRAVISLMQNYSTVPIPLRVLDLGCGTGQLARVLCEDGMRVIGIDLSIDMLYWASRNCGKYMREGKASFIVSDMARLGFKSSCFDVVTCSYDSINHLPDELHIRECIFGAASKLRPGGIFVFDINTIKGLEDWNRIKITERADRLIVSRGFFNQDEGRAWKKFSGFIKLADNSYFRFEQIIFNIALPIHVLSSYLTEAGFVGTRFAKLQSVSNPCHDPEEEDRVIVIAYRDKN